MPDKTKILIVNPSANFGGGTTISNNLAHGLDKDRFEVSSFFPAEGPGAKALAEADSRVHLAFPDEPGAYGIVRKLRSLIKEGGFDVVHAQGTRAALWVKLACLFLRRRPGFVYTLHGLHIAHRPALQRGVLLALERSTNRSVDKLVCVSDSVKTAAERYSIIAGRKISVIYNGIDINKFSEAQPLPRASLGIPDNTLVISAIQRLDYPKDVFTVLKAFATAKNKIPSAFLLVVGSGPFELQLRTEAEALEDRAVRESIVFVGDRNDMERIVASSDVVALSSAYEALGLSLIEAMAARKPVIGTAVEGINEVIKEGENGFLVEFGNAAAMAGKMIRLLGDASLRERMGLHGSAIAKEKFATERMVAEYSALYKKFDRIKI